MSLKMASLTKLPKAEHTAFTASNKRRYFSLCEKRSIKKQKSKNGYEDFMQDDEVKVSTTQKATRVVKEAALDRDENSR